MASTSTAAPPASSILFARGTLAILQTWPILTLAVQSSWGGPKSSAKRTWLASSILDEFESASIQPDDQYIEELLLQVMQDEFEVDVEDGSAEPIAKALVKLWEETSRGEEGGVKLWEEKAEKLRGKKVEAKIEDLRNVNEDGEDVDDGDEDWEDDDGGEDDEMEDVPQLLGQQSERPKRSEPHVDEDGFTVVKKGSKRH
ncbi:Pre-rRNA-processing protein TSR2-domain-containing protein [Coprinopsis sp. MPI-PUGE-AT-0042]|nr:Pre-rRNA-processing protein TSR2-domain-containing protein [Coprinopsis sp. MPI-PUGE-AT-0042]